MTWDMATLWRSDLAAVVIMVGLGLFCVATQRNLIKVLIGIEVLARAVTLCLVSAGLNLDKQGVASALTIVCITLDAAVVAVALALVVNAARHYGGISARRLTRLKG
ncbi:MAG: NADH-quinone oxidoreductase subunit K [Acetobacteraceae bacterium]|nr:NADH-quinone oxidoreductase subunit K [Acetobacteraceae bacterium]